MLPDASHVRNFHLVPLFSGVINLLLAIFVLTARPRRRLNRIYFGLGFTLAWWNFGSFFFFSSLQSASTALLQVRVAVAISVFLPALLYHLAVETTEGGRGSWKILAGYVTSALLFCLNFTPAFIDSVRAYQQYFRPNPGPAFWAFSMVFLPIAAYGTLSSLISFLNRTPSSSTRSAKFLLVAVSVLWAGVFHDMIHLAGFDFYPGTKTRIIPWGTFSASLFALVIAYSILSDQLFDIRVSISKHSATVLRLCFFAGVAFVLMLTAGVFLPGTFSAKSFSTALAVMFVSATITVYFSPKLFGSVSGRIEKGILGDHFEYQDKVAAFIDSAHEVTDSQQLLNETVDLVIDQLSLTAVGIAIVSGDVKTRSQSSRSTNFPVSWADFLSPDSRVVHFFRTTGVAHIDIGNDFLVAAEERAVRGLLSSSLLQHAFAIGSRLKDPLGVLVIGPRRDGRQLTELDIDLLHSLCRNLVSRVERIAIYQNERLRQANEAKDRFLASINHEIRNPLNGITGIVRMLKENAAVPPSDYLLSTLQSCTDQLRASMDEVLDFTCIESDRVTLTVLDVHLADLVGATCASHDLSGKLIVFEPGPGRDVVARCDPGKVRQIVSNYIANAIKYGAPIGGKVRLLIEETGPAAARIKITVTSTGTTLSQEELGTLFTPLTRGRRARETNAHGTGLGLALCKKLAVAMGATVGVESGGGHTTFWFAAEFPTTSKTTVIEPAILYRFAGWRALAIEDEPYNRLVLGHHFKQLGIDPTWAENGQTALAALKSQDFDVILMDWLLPDIDGAELLERAKLDRQSPLPPVIVVSAYSTTSKRAECLAAGAVAFISKPLDVGKLNSALAECQLGS